MNNTIDKGMLDILPEEIKQKIKEWAEGLKNPTIKNNMTDKELIHSIDMTIEFVAKELKKEPNCILIKKQYYDQLVEIVNRENLRNADKVITSLYIWREMRIIITEAITKPFGIGCCLNITLTEPF